MCSSKPKQVLFNINFIYKKYFLFHKTSIKLLFAMPLISQQKYKEQATLNAHQDNKTLPRNSRRIPAKLLRKKNKTCFGFEVRLNEWRTSIKKGTIYMYLFCLLIVFQYIRYSIILLMPFLSTTSIFCLTFDLLARCVLRTISLTPCTWCSLPQPAL